MLPVWGTEPAAAGRGRGRFTRQVAVRQKLGRLTFRRPTDEYVANLKVRRIDPGRSTETYLGFPGPISLLVEVAPTTIQRPGQRRGDDAEQFTYSRQGKGPLHWARQKLERSLAFLR